MSHIYEHRQYIIFNVSELDKIDFDTVLETSAETVRKNVAETRTFVKWNGTMPECVSSLETGEGPYNHDEILEILNGPEWTAPIDEGTI